MMKFEIYILQKKSQDPKMYQEAMAEYLKRLGAYAKVSVAYKKNAKQVEKILKRTGRALSYHARKRQYDKPGPCTADQ
ncbi:MAG: hypothetical protein ACLUTO_03085 [Anaerostipes sp.]